jgi:hypothetical protein
MNLSSLLSLEVLLLAAAGCTGESAATRCKNAESFLLASGATPTAPTSLVGASRAAASAGPCSAWPFGGS